jgi:hypothetical protein
MEDVGPALIVMAGMVATGRILLTVTCLRPRLSLLGDLAIFFMVGAASTTLVVFWVSLAVPAAGLTVGLAMLTMSLVAAGVILAVRLRSRFAVRACRRCRRGSIRSGCSHFLTQARCWLWSFVVTRAGTAYSCGESRRATSLVWKAWEQASSLTCLASGHTSTIHS